MLNKYTFANDAALLKKPHKKLVPQGPDLGNFVTGNTELLKTADFGLEMMKFLPKFEQLTYAGKMMGKENDPDSIKITFAGQPIWVTKEWLTALREYGIAAGDPSVPANSPDANGDGQITNDETVTWLKTGSAGADNYIFGQHHRVGRFGPFGSEDDSGFAGSGTGARFKNLGFVSEAADWNHIYQKGGTTTPNSQAAGIVEQAYFIKGFLSAVGKTWQDVQNVLNKPGLKGRSLYEIVMDGSYKKLSAEEGALLIAAMYEARQRGWQAMTNAFGPVTDTRDDKKMINDIDKGLLSKVNSYTDSHELALFPFFMSIQHSVTNQMTMFYEANQGDGYNYSVLDKQRFWDFSQWTGRLAYDGKGNNGVLQTYRDSLKDPKAKKAVDQLINDWFGATDPQKAAAASLAEPLWEGYGDVNVKDNWLNVQGKVGTVEINSGNNQYPTVQPTEADQKSAGNPSYGWDRKWSPGLSVKYNGGQGDAVGLKSNVSSLFNLLYGNQSSITLGAGLEGGHYNYTVAQFTGLGFNQIVGGPAFVGNWVVHAVGMYFKHGEGKDIVRVMEKIDKSRVAAAQFKTDVKDYMAKKEELEDGKVDDERAAAKGKAKAKRPQPAQDYKAGTPQYTKAMQGLRNRLLGASAKNKAWLQKTKQNNS